MLALVVNVFQSLKEGRFEIKGCAGDWREATGQVTLAGVLSEACNVRYTAAAARAFFGYFYTSTLDLRYIQHKLQP